MASLINKIIHGVEQTPPVIKGGYGTAPSTPLQQTHESGTWGTASPSEATPQQDSSSTQPAPTPASEGKQ